jgi:hypothetical protein
MLLPVAIILYIITYKYNVPLQKSLRNKYVIFNAVTPQELGLEISTV